MRLGRNYKLEQGGIIIPPDPGPGELNQYELMMDAVWRGYEGLTTNGVKATPGQPILSIPPKKGLYLMNHGGVVTNASSAIQGIAPIMQPSGAVRIDNIPEQYFFTQSYGLKPFPFEYTIVSENHPTQPFEAKLNSWESDTYFGYGQDDTRIGENNKYLLGSGLPGMFKRTIEHVLRDVDGDSLWRDGVFKGKIPRDNGRISRKTTSTIFTDTNNFAWDCFALYEKYGKFTDAERTAYLASIATVWNQGQDVSLPYAFNIREYFANNTWTQTHTTSNIKGLPIVSTEYKWILNRRLNGQGDFGDQVIVGTSATLDKSAYISLVNGLTPDPEKANQFNGVYYIKLYIKKTDSEGGTYGFMTSPGYVNEVENYGTI